MTAPTRLTDQSQNIGYYVATDRPWYNHHERGNPLFEEKRLIMGGGGHFGYPNFPAIGDVGGAFCVETRRRAWQDTYKGKIRAQGPYRTDTYDGVLYASLGLGDFLGDGVHVPRSPESYGAEAYSAMKPTKPEFNAVTSVVELRDLVPMLRQRFLEKGWQNFNSGSLYLAYQFGWKPLLNDVANLYVTQQKLEKRIKQLLRDNGKPVRRRWKAHGTDPVVTTSVFTDEYGHIDPLNSFVGYFYSGSQSGVIKSTAYNDIWASAKFRYWLAAGPGDILWKPRLIAALYGAYASPAQIYRAIPWTWLIDWFGKLSVCLDNMDAGVADRLAADYFYMMCHSGTSTLKSVTGHVWNEQLEPVEIHVSTQTVVDVKSRLKGDPFGINSDHLSMNPSQLAILGALGLSRVR